MSRRLGERSEVWLWRQIVGFKRIVPSVICWKHVNRNDYSCPNIAINVLDFPERPSFGPMRWGRRLRNIQRGNFYGATGVEKQHLARLMRETRPSVILCHFGHTALRVLPVARRFGIPVVVHFHGSDLSASLRNRWYRWSLAKELHSFASIVVVGSHQRKAVVNRGIPKQKVHLIPCGVPTDEFTPLSTRSFEPLRFICVSRLMEFKGVFQSIAAFKMVHEEFPDSELIVLGDGPDRISLNVRVQELGLESAVHFLGAQPPAEVSKWLRRSNVFLQHSLDGSHGEREGFGVTIAEASSCALPVVVTRCGGIPDQVVDGETGFILPQRNVEAMANAMMQLARAPGLRRSMGKAGRSHMVQHFDNRNQIAKLEDVLLAVSGSSR